MSHLALSTRPCRSKSNSREGPGHLPSWSGAYPFVPPRTLSICAKHTRKNDKLSHLPAFRRPSRTERQPRCGPRAGPYNRRSKRLFWHGETPNPHPFVAFGVPPELFDRGKAGNWGRWSENRWRWVVKGYR